jgi:sodium-dependent phosphate cotransporter
VRLKNAAKVFLFIIVLYLFLLSNQLMGASFKLLGGGFAETLIQTTSNPFVGLLIGILATTIINPFHLVGYGFDTMKNEEIE